ncbi:MAG TPA: hypothetical protein DCW31_10890 [Lactobacillus sp.]|nr:hypothetical protein [Lactobacillus sp.]
MSLKLEFESANGDRIQGIFVEDTQHIVRDFPYLPGDKYVITTDHPGQFVYVQLDAALSPALVYVKQTKWEYQIPFDFQKESPYAPGAFSGKRHYAWAKFADQTQIAGERDLALNSHDQHELSGAFPHAESNSETRGESVFFAKNAIDGVLANEYHGNYPHQSWGPEETGDTWLKLDFGREVIVSQIRGLFRADFPHDGVWQSAKVEFSDGSQQLISPIHSDELQKFPVDHIKTSTLKLFDLDRTGSENEFHALSELVVLGTEL